MKTRSWSAWLVFLLLILAVAAGYFYWKRQHAPNPAERYRTVAVTRGNLTETVSANGTLNPVVLVNVGTQVSGTVKKWYADFNDEVKKGQVLLKLDPSLFEAQVRQSQANLANAESQLKLAEDNDRRERMLFAQQYVSRQDMDTSDQAVAAARAQVALARAQLDKDKINLGYTVIRSPVSGVVVSRQVDVGQTVAASFQTPTLFTIAQDLSKMQIDSSYAEADVGDIKVGQQAVFTVDAYPNRTFHGLVHQIRLNPTTQQNVVTYDVVISVANPDQILLPGMTAYVNIIVAKRENVLLVPNAALRFHPVQPVKRQPGQRPPQTAHQGTRRGPVGTVYVLDNGQPRAVRVEVGITDTRNTEILGDRLKVGERVIVEDLRPQANEERSFGRRMRFF